MASSSIPVATHPYVPLHTWQPPAPRICELLRQGAEQALILMTQTDLLSEMEQAGRSTTENASVQDDPLLMAMTRRATRSSLIHWLNATLEHPEQPVSPHVSADMLDNARELFRLGMPELMLNATRASQNVAWQRWMNIAFHLTNDTRELQQLLEVSSRSIANFVDGSVTLIQAQLRDEQELGIRDLLLERRQLVTRILEGAHIDLRDASRRLDYPLENRHHAAIIWSEETGTELATLEAAAEAFVRASGQKHMLRVIVSGAVIWVWASADTPIDGYAIQSAMRNLPSVRMTFGSGGNGIDGFRRAHVDALTAQRVLGRMRSSARAVSFDQLRLASLMSRDPEACQRYIAHVLGDLAHATPVLRQTLRRFLECSCNATEAAQQLHTHRNTFLRRLEKAEALLPRPLANQWIQVAAALDYLQWSE